MPLLSSSSGPVQESNLAWTFDRNHLYANFLATNFNDVPAVRGGNTSTVPIDTDQHLMVWMRVGAHATVRKLYATINTDIPAGETLESVAACRCCTWQLRNCCCIWHQSKQVC